MSIFIIVEKKDVGSRDTIYRYLVGTESVYGGKPLPYFTSRSAAKDFLGTLESYRHFEILRLERS